MAQWVRTAPSALSLVGTRFQISPIGDDEWGVYKGQQLVFSAATALEAQLKAEIMAEEGDVR